MGNCIIFWIIILTWGKSEPSSFKNVFSAIAYVVDHANFSKFFMQLQGKLNSYCAKYVFSFTSSCLIFHVAFKILCYLFILLIHDVLSNFSVIVYPSDLG